MVREQGDGKIKEQKTKKKKASWSIFKSLGSSQRNLVVRQVMMLLCTVAVETNLDLGFASSSSQKAVKKEEYVCVCGHVNKMTGCRYLKVKLEV